MSFSTPIALLIFNRPDLTKVVFDAIAQVKPKKLFIIADGPRYLEEAKKCEEARGIVRKIEWKCEVFTNFSDKNLGCKHRVSTGLDWVFSQVDEAIILEDDCLPTNSFFDFCQSLLEYYRYDERIMHINGSNFQGGKIRNKYSYFFSKYNHIWGWATWRRAWKYYDVHISLWPEHKNSNFLNSACDDLYEHKYWADIFEQVFQGKIDTWDYQWIYTCWLQHGLSISPNVNLVSNLGFRMDATHTYEENAFAKLKTKDIRAIEHPSFIFRDKEADYHIFNSYFNEQTSDIKYAFLKRLQYYWFTAKRKFKKSI